jgi:hypothetical protein
MVVDTYLGPLLTGSDPIGRREGDTEPPPVVGDNR